MAYLSLDSNPAKAGLAEMLVNLQRQGAAQTAQVGPMLGEGLAQMLQGFQRQGDLARQREFADVQRQKDEAARARQATVDWQRSRVDTREERGFRERIAKMRGPSGSTAPNYDKLIVDLEGKIAEGKAYGTDVSGLERERDRLRGLRGDLAMQPSPEAPPPPAPGGAAPPKTYADVAAEKQASVAKRAEADKAKATLRAGVAADIEKMLVAATPEGDPKIAKAAADKIGRIMADEGEPLIMVAGSTQAPKSKEGHLLNMALRLQTRGVPEQEIINRVMAAARTEPQAQAGFRASRGQKPLAPLGGRAPGSVDLTPADIYTFLRYMDSTIK